MSTTDRCSSCVYIVFSDDTEYRAISCPAHDADHAREVWARHDEVWARVWHWQRRRSWLGRALDRMLGTY